MVETATVDTATEVSVTKPPGCGCAFCTYAFLGSVGAPLSPFETPRRVIPINDEDFPQVLEVSVTDRDISLGIRRNAAKCAISRAVGRRFDGLEVHTGGALIRIRNGSDSVWYQSVDIWATQAFITAFDNNAHVTPQTFAYKRVNDPPFVEPPAFVSFVFAPSGKE